MTSHARQWLEQRWPLSSLARWFLHEKIDGGSRFAYVFGSASMFLFILQVFTGVWQMFYYVPTIDHAYDSVSYLRLQVPFGWLIHGMHYWGSNAFIVVIGLHVIRTFIWGAYKKPRELTWLLGVALLLLAAALIFTGAILPWDNMGYWAGEVGTSIVGTVPGIGNFLKLLVRGGPEMEQLALSREFVSHVAILPGLMAIFILLHLVAFRQFGSVGPWNPVKAQRHIGWFWPGQIFKDMIFISVLAVLLVVLSAYSPAPITGPADPLDSSYAPKPEWNFLFLYQGLKVFKGSWEPVGTVVIPVLVVALLLAVPFLDRSPHRSPAKRPVVMTCGFLFVAGVLGLTLLGYYSTPGPPQGSATQPGGAASPAPQAQNAAAATPTASRADEGRNIFVSSGCGACHAVSGAARLLGPDLRNEGDTGRSAAWLREQIVNPRSHNSQSIMPPAESLSPQQLDDLVAYMQSLTTGGKAPVMGAASSPAHPETAPSAPAPTAELPELPQSGKQGPPGRAAGVIGNPSLGNLLYRRFCQSCHGAGGVPNPGSTAGRVPPLMDIDRKLFSPNPQQFANKIDPYIQEGSKTPGPHPAIDMPAFGTNYTLTQQQISNIEAYILQLNAVDRAEIISPGVAPRKFAMITVVVFAAIGAAVAVAWLAGSRRPRKSP